MTATRALVVALVTTVLSPVMAEMGSIIDDRGFTIPCGGE